MKTFYIYNISNDEYLGEVTAYDILSAERKAFGIFPDVNSDYIAAFSEKFN